MNRLALLALKAKYPRIRVFMMSGDRGGVVIACPVTGTKSINPNIVKVDHLLSINGRLDVPYFVKDIGVLTSPELGWEEL